VKKPMKYVALTLSTVATVLLVLALVGMANRIGSGGRALPPVQNSLPPLSAQQVSDQAEVKLALQSLDKFPSARFFASTGGSGSAASPGASAAPDGSIFALSAELIETPASVPRKRTTAAVKSGPLNPLPLPRVSVVLKSGADGKAVINGHLVRVGDPVGDGMVVNTISVEAVTFSSGKEILEVRMPLDRLRVLGAFPGSTKGN
jgi:hypothetical protein